MNSKSRPIELTVAVTQSLADKPSELLEGDVHTVLGGRREARRLVLSNRFGTGRSRLDSTDNKRRGSSMGSAVTAAECGPSAFNRQSTSPCVDKSRVSAKRRAATKYGLPDVESPRAS